MNKRGVVFTVIVVILISVILLAFLINLENRSKVEAEEITVKVETVNSFVSTLNNQYLPLALRTSSNQVILSLLDYIESTSKDFFPADQFNTIFETALIKGEYSVDNSPLNLMSIDNLNYNFSLDGVLGEIISSARQTGIILSIDEASISQIGIKQEDPWHLNATLKMNYSVRDDKNEVRWDLTNKEITVLINIEGYRDPLYLVKEGLNVTIRKTEVVEWDLDKFKQFIFDSEFNAVIIAPNFLQRLQGQLGGSSENGIESILNPFYYPNPAPQDSNVDYLFWNAVPGEGTCTVTGMPSDFRLDQPHFTLYDGLLEGSC